MSTQIWTYTIFWINLHCRITGRHMFEYIALFPEPLMASWHNIMKYEWKEGEIMVVHTRFWFSLSLHLKPISELKYNTKIIWFPTQIVIVWYCIVYYYLLLRINNNIAVKLILCVFKYFNFEKWLSKSTVINANKI